MNDSASLFSTQVGESGRPIVFLHGLFGQGRNFAQIAKAMQPEFRSLLVDLPNHGRSRWTTRLDYLVVSDVVADAVREHFAGEPVHLVGHSMGGKIAMIVALRHPDLLDRLVVADISPVTHQDMGEFAHLLDSLAALDLGTVERRSDADALLSEPIPDPRVRGFLLQNLRPDDAGGWRWRANLDLLRSELDVIGGFPDLEAEFPRPTLWLAGEKSRYVRPEYEKRMRELFPKTVLVTVKGAGHWIHSEKPDAFVSALRTFLGAAGR